MAAVSVSVLALSGLPLASAQQQTTEFAISNITDFHGRWQASEDGKTPGAVALKCAIDAYAGDKAHAFVSSGDNIGAAPFADMVQNGEPTIDILNAMGLDVSAVGNHEFDQGADDLTGRVVPEANWTYLAAGANGLDRSTGIEDYKIMDLGGVKVAFVGAVTDEMPSLVSPEGIEGISWEKPATAINRVADDLTTSGAADVVIALPHEGNIPADAWSDNVDAVFMGHTHEYVEETDSTPVIFQAGNYSQGLANITFSYDKDADKVTLTDSQLLRAKDISACTTPNAELQEIIDAALAVSAEEGAKVIGTLDQPLYRATNEGEGSGSNRGAESQLNNLLANVAKWRVERNSNVVPDIGVMNAGGVRADLPEGEITYQEAFEVQPFGNEITYTTLKGADFIAALEQQWQPGEERALLSLGVSDNVSYTYDPKAAQGEHITSVLIDGEPIDPNRDYIVAGSTFLLTGGDKFEALTKGTPLANLGYQDIQAFTEYLDAYLVNSDAPAPRTGQANVGVSFNEPLVAGTTATINLSSLHYTQAETAKQVTVALGDATATAEINPDLGPANLNEAGTATVELALPATLTGEQQLHITTDAGTDVWLPVTITGDNAPEPDNNQGSSGSSQGSSSFLAGSSFGVFSTVLAVIASIIAGIGGLLAAQPQIVDFLRQNVPGLPIEK